MSHKNLKNEIKYAPLLIGAIMCLSAGFINKAQAQEVQLPACSQDLPTCPPERTLDLTQNQSSNVSAGINIVGNAITIDVPSADPNNPPATVSASAISSTSSAINNTISAKSADTTPLNYGFSQTSTGSASAMNDVTTLASVSGMVNLITTSNGNSAQAEICCSSMDLIANQNQNTGVVSAYSKATLAPDLGTMVLNSQANGNNVAISGDGASGLISQVVNQNNASQISSITETSMCCNNLIASQNALAVGNSSASSTYSASAYQWVSQNNNGEVKSSSDTMTSDGRGLVTTSQSVGNSNLQYNNSGYTQGSVYQYSNGDINSYSATRAIWYNDSATVGAAAQGNSAVLSTIGSDGLFLVDQNIGATGTVTATAEFYGMTSGGVGGVAASASGNGLVGFACSGCGKSGIQITGDTSQINDANVNANVNFNTYGTGGVKTYGLAAGNSATFIAQNGTSIK